MRRTLLTSVACLTLLATGAEAGLLSLRSTLLDGKKVDLIQSVKLQGDLRLRHDSINYQTSPAYTGANTPGAAERRARQHTRFRLRVGADIGLPYDFSTSLGLASGKGEQTSTNQSFEGMGTSKSIWIDYAYLQWAPKRIRLAGGKVKNPFWRIASSDLLWDTDVNPEGFSQSADAFNGAVFLNALQWNVNENGSSAQASLWMFGQQLGAEVKLPLESRLRAAGTWYKWTKERLRSDAATNPATKAADGNRRGSDGILWNEFNVAEVTGELSSRVSKVPVRLQGTYINNMAARHDLDRWGRQQEGYQFGGIIGESKEKNSWEVAFFQKWLEADATIADVTDADFGEGGTNRRGQIFWLAYSPLDWMEFRTKYLHTRTINESLKPWRNDINRLQADLTVKF